MAHFFISAPLIPHAVDSNISPITWSDHALIILDLSLQTPTSKTCHWHLNDHLLSSSAIKERLARDLGQFFQLNVGSV